MAMTALIGTIRTITATPASTDGPRFCTTDKQMNTSKKHFHLNMFLTDGVTD